MAITDKDKVCKEIAEALGIKHCKKLHLKMEVNSIVTVDAEFYPEIDGVMQLPAILKKYKLVPISETEETTGLGYQIKTHKVKAV